MKKRIPSFFMSATILLSSVVGVFPTQAAAIEPSQEVNNITRIEGVDRYKTAVKISQDVFPEGTKQAVIASGEKFADALVGGNLAAHVDGPILLVRENEIPEDIAKELDRLKLDNIYIVGGEHSVSKAVESTLKDYAETVDRLEGDNRYLTSVDVAEHMVEEGAVGGVAYASGENFPDALAGSALLAHLGNYTLILTDGKSIPEGAPDSENKLVFGGENLINIAGLENATRYGAGDRFLTSIEIARKGFTGYHAAIVVDGTNYPDALTAVALARKYDAPILLTYPELITGETLEAMKDLGKIVIVGGESSVSKKVEEQIINPPLTEKPAEKPTDPEDTEKPVDPEDTEKPVGPEDTDKPVNPEDTEKPVKADKTGLAAAIKNAQAMLDEGKIYTHASKKYLNYALINGRKIINDVNASQKEVDEIIKYLEDATKTLVEIDQGEPSGPINPVDKSGVIEAIKKAQAELNDGEKYTEKSKKQLKERLEWADLAKDNIYETEAGIDYIMRQLEKAIDSLVVKADDKTGLVELINTAEEKLDEREKYITRGIERLEEALDKAIKLNNDLDSSKIDVQQSEIDLGYAIDSLEERADKTGLVDAIRRAKEKLGEKENYTKISIDILEEELDKAIQVNNDLDIHQWNVRKAEENLDGAIKILIKKAEDKTGLVEAINSLEEKLENKEIYTQQSIENLEEALNEARKINVNPDSSEVEVIDVLNKIKEIVYNLEERAQDKFTLEEVINQAESRLAEDKNYTELSKETLKDALEEAKKAYNDPDAKQWPVDLATNNLEEAIKNLGILAEDKKGLEKAIKEAEAKLNDGKEYTKSSIKELERVLDEANQVFKNSDASQKEVDKIQRDLEYATVNLEELAKDKSELKKYILQAEKKEKDGKDYTESSRENLRRNLYWAREVCKDSDASQNQVDSITGELKYVIENLAEIWNDKDQLKEAIEKVEEKIKEKEKYTEESIKRLKDQLDCAKEVYDDQDASQNKVDEQKNLLENQINLLVKKEDSSFNSRNIRSLFNIF